MFTALSKAFNKEWKQEDKSKSLNYATKVFLPKLVKTRKLYVHDMVYDEELETQRTM